MMKRLIASFCVASLVACTGCNSSPTGGRENKTTSPSGHVSSSNKETFKLSGPETATKVEQGKSNTFKLKISRGVDFKDDVALKVESPDPKLHVTLDPTTFKGSETKDVEATVKADNDAKIGKEMITITGAPQAGKATNLEVEIEVTAQPKNK
jgi:uncharacterized membrane protein